MKSGNILIAKIKGKQWQQLEREYWIIEQRLIDWDNICLLGWIVYSGQLN